MSRPPLGEWEVEFLRATAFKNEALPTSYGDESWKKVVGAEAEEITRKAALSAYSASGPVDAGMLSLNIAPGRIDWLFGPANLEAVLDHSLGKFTNQDELFAERLLNWLQFPSVAITRIAFGEVLRLPVANRTAGYRALGEFLPRIAPDPESSRDFVYQINRPRDSKSIRGVMVNRLSKWASMELNTGVIGSAKPFASMQFVRLELDLSTDKDSEKDLSKDKCLNLMFQELISLGREIATEGDI